MQKSIYQQTGLAMLFLGIGLVSACSVPPKEESPMTVKHNYIVLLDLSDRLIVQQNQPERDKEIIDHIYSLFEKKVKSALYVKSRDEFKVVVAPQLGSRVRTDIFEDRLYVDMENIPMVHRKRNEAERKTAFEANIDSLYKEAIFSSNPEDYHGADIWKYFYEDLKVDYSRDTLTENYLFILTDGYPIVGKDQVKLREVKDQFPDLNIVLLEASPREKDMEWDRIMTVWEDWFDKIDIKEYTLIKRGAISKEKEQIKEIVNEKLTASN
ncbi:MAG: hypothetical protein RIG68_11140 [Imperialibacter sp.]|uniref:hypothetical protein n=1 Tax=Imperialibacter sp. TaxID=2038411 RepID=UPI0032F01C2F